MFRVARTSRRSTEIDRLREQNAALEARLRRLQKRRASHEALNYVFIVTYGRSGSTLLMGILNSIPGFLIRGENWDALHHLFRYHQTLLKGSRRWRRSRMREMTHPFYGAEGFPAQKSLEGIRELAIDTLFRPRNDTRVTGFKEIRWSQEDVEQYVAWLQEVFPGARFVFNTRAHDEVLSSGWWPRVADNAAVLAAIEERTLALAASLGDAAYRIHYNEYVSDPSVLAGLFAWLGEPFDEAGVRAVLGSRHSVALRRTTPTDLPPE